jgi:D-alanine-D-alanine ligase-like ATP-grasp enzyme
LTQAKQVAGVDDGVFVERFLEGREFTALCTGSKDEGVTVHQVAERVFNKKLGKYERILAFDKYWEGYGLDGSKPETDSDIYKYAAAPTEHQEHLKQIARNAFLAVQGSGYGRVDMRTDSHDSMNVFVLEVNANCGVSFDPNEFTSTVGEILRMSQEPVEKFANELIQFALERRARTCKLT